jgi:predicted nucleic acid-binding protein
MRAYLDTNIIVSYLWNSFYEGRGKKSVSYRLVNQGGMGKFEIYISFYTLMEIHEHFTDYYLQQNSIKDGFGFREFPKERRNYVLDNEQLSTVASMLKTFRASPYLNYIEPETMTEGFFKEVMKYVEGYMDFVDALHLRTAIDTECDYFVTNDGELRKRAQKLICNKTITEKIRISSSKGFLKEL